MLSCSCGRPFGSQVALDQHQIAKGRVDGAAFSCPGVSARKPRGDAWLWRNVKSRTAVQTIALPELVPSADTITSASECHLLCTYNWQNCKTATIQVPGLAPVWQDIPLPMTIPSDSGTYFVDQNAARVPEYSFEPVFRATALMNAGVRFDDVDIVVNRNSLRKLLEFCGGQVRENFRVNLLMVQNTLFIERCDRSARQLIHGSQNSGCGRNFERAFTKYPPGVVDSAGHHRVLRYKLGALNCAVRFEVDAAYEKQIGEESAASAGERTESGRHDAEDLKLLTLQMGEASIKGPAMDRDTGGQSKDSTGQENQPLQSTAAEIKTGKKLKSVNSCLSQLWFGRTPWLIMGRHKDGTFHDVKVTNVEPQFLGWERSNQQKLRKLVAILTQLRGTVKNVGRNCVAICERHSHPHAIKVLALEEDRRALPEDRRALPENLINMFWVSENDTANPSSSLPPRA